jgi:hypothetical protein
MGMAEKAVKKAVKSGAPKEAKEAVSATLQTLAKPESKKLAKPEAQKTVVAATRVQSEVQAPPAKTRAKAEAQQAKEPVKIQPEITEKPEAPKEKAIKETVKAASEVTEVPKAEAKKEADPSKEFVDGIMAEMSLKGASKKRLIRTLAEQYNFDKQKVMFRLKRALITERYAAAHAEGSAH